MSTKNEEIKDLSLNDIVVVSNTRTDFNEKGLKELAASISENGVIEPVIVTEMEDGRYRLICGERRYRASLIAGQPDIPAVVKNVPDNKILQFQIVENLQRRGLSTMEEVRAIVRLRDEESMSHVEIAKAIGKALSHVEAQIKISKAIPEVHAAIEGNQVTRQVGLVISSLPEGDQLKAVSALKRDSVSFLVKTKEAENWIHRHLGVQPKKAAFGHSGKGGNKIQPKNTGGRFASDWKYYLVRFSAEQFAEFQDQVGVQTQTEV